MTELVGDDTLEFVAGQGFKAPLRDCHDRVLRGKAGGKGIDPIFIRQDVNPRNRDAGGDRHLLYYIQQQLFLWLLAVRGYLNSPQKFGDPGAALF